MSMLCMVLYVMVWYAGRCMLAEKGRHIYEDVEERTLIIRNGYILRLCLRGGFRTTGCGQHL